jgi:hypothetical protein
VIKYPPKAFVHYRFGGRPIENFDHNVPCCSEKLKDNDSEGILWHSGDVELHNEGKNINLDFFHLVDMPNAAHNC